MITDQTLPGNWIIDRFKDIAVLRNDTTDQKSEKEDYIELEDIESHTGKVIRFRNTLDVQSLLTLYKTGDVLFGKLRPYLAKFYLAKQDGKCTGEILAFEPIRIISKYLLWLVASPDFIELCNAQSYGPKMPRVSWNKQLSLFQLPLPPFFEQKLISAYLDKTTSIINKAVSVKKEQLKKLVELKKSIIYKAVTKGLDDSVEMKDSGIEWIGEIPDGWEVKRIKDVGNIKYGLGQPPKELDEGLPLIRATNVYRGKIDPTNMIFVDPEDIPYERDPVLRENDIIVVRSGAYTADSAIIPKEYDGAITGYDMVIRCNSRILPRFLSFALLSKYLLNNQLLVLSLRAAQPHINREELGSSIILLPSIKEQRVIITYLDQKTSEIDSVSEKITLQIEKLEGYKKSLIHEYVTGKRRITETDIPEAV